MGIWGAGIYENDDSCQARDDFIYLLRSGFSAEEASDDILDSHSELIVDIEIEAPIIFALAETQWKFGRVVEKIAKRAIEIIDLELDLTKWNDVDQKLFLKRKKALISLRSKLLLEPPPEKAIRPLRIKKPKHLFPKGKIGYAYSVEVEDGVFVPFVIYSFDSPSRNIEPIFYALPFSFSKRDISIKDIPKIQNVVTLESGLGGTDIFGISDKNADKKYYSSLFEIGEIMEFDFTTNKLYPSYFSSMTSIFKEIFSKCVKVS
ncbi:MAG TPA: hypothetical protein VL995_05415 [Cellvibrio sp.]|nr:hypothetical protein [Cellvibrio sp.]